MKKSGSIPQALYFRLRSSANKTPLFYGLPKIHKLGIPLRPIVSFVNSPTYQLSKHLVTILSPLVGHTSSYVKNSTEFAKFISTQNLPTGNKLVSFDVVSLFTTIPVERAKEIAYNRLLQDTSLCDRTLLSPSEVSKLLEFCLNATYLAYRGDFYQQTFGTAMGSPVSVTVANLVMEDVEDRAISGFEISPTFWKRFVDDISTSLPEDKVQPFLSHLNSVEPSIDFTVELENENKLSFLDTEISHHPDGSLTTTVFRKKTHTDRYLAFDSHHPTSQKVAVARTLFTRAENICSTMVDKDEERTHISNVLQANGYPHSLIENNSRLPSRLHQTDESTNRTQPKATVVIPYIKNVSEGIRRILSKVDIRTCFKPNQTLRQLLVHPKDKIPLSGKTGVVYQVDCSSCGSSYVGQTGRTLQHRVKEHQRALTSYTPYTTSAVAEHSMKTGHNIEWESAKVLEVSDQYFQRTYLEAWNIRLHSQTMNRDDGILPQTYNSLILAEKLSKARGIDC